MNDAVGVLIRVPGPALDGLAPAQALERMGGKQNRYNGFNIVAPPASK